MKSVAEALYTPSCLKSQSIRGRKMIFEETMKAVTEFYVRGCASQCCPGRREFIKVNGSEVQKRHLYLTVIETYHIFKEENSQQILGKAKFAKLSSPNVFSVCDTPKNTCVCATHFNFISTQQLTSKYICTISSSH